MANSLNMGTDSIMSVEEWLTVGRLDASLALLTTKNHHVIEFPTMLLPDNIKAGSIVKIQVSEDQDLEKKEFEQFQLLQNDILEKYGTHRPQNPVLNIINVTQTSGVLGWDALELGSAQLKSLVLYKDGVRSLMIPNPFKTTATKISGLSVDCEYSFQLRLSTTSGDLWSDKVVLHTHKMTDMSGITACLGTLDGVQGVTKLHIQTSLNNIGAKPLQSHVTIDTTHFISNDTDSDDPELQKAQQSNIPVVRPEWVRACELERRIVGVRGFYLDADTVNLESYKFSKLSAEEGQPGMSTQNKELPIPSQDRGTPASEDVAHAGVSQQSTGISNASLKSEAEPEVNGRSQSAELDLEASESVDPTTNSDVEDQAEKTLSENEPVSVEERSGQTLAKNKEGLESNVSLEEPEATNDVIEEPKGLNIEDIKTEAPSDQTNGLSLTRETFEQNSEPPKISIESNGNEITEANENLEQERLSEDLETPDSPKMTEKSEPTEHGKSVEVSELTMPSETLQLSESDRGLEPTLPVGSVQSLMPEEMSKTADHVNQSQDLDEYSLPVERDVLVGDTLPSQHTDPEAFPKSAEVTKPSGEEVILENGEYFEQNMHTQSTGPIEDEISEALPNSSETQAPLEDDIVNDVPSSNGQVEPVASSENDAGTVHAEPSDGPNNAELSHLEPDTDELTGTENTPEAADSTVPETTNGNQSSSSSKKKKNKKNKKKGKK
ncbi:LANO_0F04896g1_1 [Lachancea nothofagi CBS 11611]|uniref:Chitin biosynthesis protein CHS5 n=1 Tax=Lachancea nothofagi CBS 11611 TaxID=1266666 RepID=A0A1G4K7S3_9SACH|nr:LANO_0F04896g1_1 [Lachancea nothofagi CBS 11611]